MRALVLEPGYCPYVAIFQDYETAIAEVVKGKHKIDFPFDNNVIALVSSAEQENLPFNRSIALDDFLNGKALILGWQNDKLCGLTRKQADRYYRKYLYPEHLQDVFNGVIPVQSYTKVKPLDERYGNRIKRFLER